MVRLFERKVIGTSVGIRAWLFKTATHLVRDRYRVDTNRKRLLEKHPVTPSAPEAPDRTLERGQARALARETLDALAPREREILLMRYSGFSYKEIAEAVVSPRPPSGLCCRGPNNDSPRASRPEIWH